MKIKHFGGGNFGEENRFFFFEKTIYTQVELRRKVSFAMYELMPTTVEQTSGESKEKPLMVFSGAWEIKQDGVILPLSGCPQENVNS